MRWLIILFASWAIAPVLAQTSSDASRQLDVGKKADLEHWAWRAQRGKAPTESERVLQACVYSAAVMATIQGEAESTGLAAAYGLQGKVKMIFAPVHGSIDIEADLVAAAITVVLADAAKRESEQQAARVAFSAYLRQTADRALKRFDKPAGISSTWRSEATYVYKTEG